MGHPTAWEQRRWAGYGEGERRGGRATTGRLVGPFDAVGKVIGKRMGENDQGFGVWTCQVFDASKTSKCWPILPIRGLSHMMEA